MNLFIYSDESGVFDKVHNDYYVYAGLIILDKDQRIEISNKYVAAENCIKNSYSGEELKAANISNKDKNKLFRSLNSFHKFAVIIKQNKILDEIFKSKKDKQRYLDYAYKIGVKNALKCMENQGIISFNEIDNMYFYVDEHTTATNGRYELKESLECEFKNGTFNHKYSHYYPPIIPKLRTLDVQFCDSKTTRLIRCADIIANKVYYLVCSNNEVSLNSIDNLYIKYLPS